MTFAAAAWWWLLVPLLPLVLVLHVRRRRHVGVSSLRLWLDAGAVRSPRARVRFAPPEASVSLILQVVGLILLVGALARPNLQGTNVDHLVLVVDASAPMLATDVDASRIDAARLWATGQIDRLDPASRVSIVRAVGQGDLVVVGALPGVARPHVASIEAEARGVDWNGVRRRVAAVVQPSESTIVRAILASGGSGDADAWLAALASTDVEVEPSVVMGTATANIGLDDLRLSRSDRELALSGELSTFGDAEGAFEISIGFQRMGSDVILPWDSVEVHAPRAGTTTFDVPIDLPGTGLLRVAVPDDAYPSDDVAWLPYVPDARPFRVLWIGSIEASLERALRSVDHVEIYRSDTQPDDAGAFDLVVVHEVVLEERPATSVLWWNVLPPGASASSDPAVEDAGAPAGGGDAGTSATPARTILAHRPLHPLARGLDARSMGTVDAIFGDVLEGADVLLSDGLGRPLVQARTTTSGREVIVGFDVATSAWPSQAALPVFVAALIDWSRFPDSVVECQVGLPCRLPVDAASGGGVVSDESGTVVAGELNAFETGAMTTWPEGVLERRFVPTSPGRYRWQGPRSTADIVVQARPVATVADGSAEASSLRTSMPRDPVRIAWWSLLGLLLITEVVRAGLAEERFLRPGWVALRGPAGRRTLRTWAGSVVLGAALVAGWLAVPLPRLERSGNAVAIVGTTEASGQAVDVDAVLDGENVGRSDRVVTLAPTRVVDRAQLRSSAGPEEAGPIDVALALDVAGAMARTEGVGRLVVIGPTPLDVANAFGALQGARGELPARLDFVRLDSKEAVLAVDGIDVPDSARAGERVDVGVRVNVTEAMDVTVTLARDGEVVGERTLTLDAGTTRVPLTVGAGDAGARRWQASAAGTGVEDSLRHVAETRPAPRVRIVSGQPGAGLAFAGLLDVQDVSSEVVVPVDMPWSVDGWEDTDAAILMNVPALDLHSQQQEVLRAWVRDHGGGLMILGGENTFGPGGYVRTPLDEVSPLSSQVEREAPEVAMVFVLDRSGSMQQRVGGVSRLEIAKEATRAALDLLGEGSFVGVVVFDEIATTVVPLTPIAERGAIEAGLGLVQANGGTAIQPALEAAYEVISQASSATRHVVLFTDGLSQPGDFGSILTRFRDDEITLSTVGIGRGTDASQLSALARGGGGTFHQTNDFRALPGILAQEALLLSGSPLEEGRIQPEWSEPGRLFDTIAPEPTPPLDGYVATTAKPEATQHLVADARTPLLASWTYGLGRVLAFASQGAGRWAEPWLAWPRTPALWADALGWLARRGGQPTAVRTERIGDALVVQVEAEPPVPGSWTMAVEGDRRPGTPMLDVAPGTVQAEWPIESLGASLLEISAPDGTTIRVVEWIDRWSADARQRDEAVVRQWEDLAALTGGMQVRGPDRTAQQGLWRWSARPAPAIWLVIAIAAWLATLVNRYVVRPYRRGPATSRSKA